MLMDTLEQSLKKFEEQIKENTQKEELQQLFVKLAPAFLYGGYIQVRDEYKIYIRTVEFYFHSETDGVHDPIVYHRNNRYIDGNVPYFPFMSIHAHASGLDITFECEKKHYRASALIRAYEIWDVRQKCYLIYDRFIQKFRKCKDEEQVFNSQSTFLYDFLNGFGKDSSIQWCNEDKFNTIKEQIKPTYRKGVFESIYPNEYVPKEKDGHKIRDERQWSFTRKEFIL